MSTPSKAPAATRLFDALDERTGFRASLSAFVGREQPGAPSFGRSLGVLVVVLFVVECLTGIALAFSYAPSMTSAWASTAHIETAVPLGAFIRGLHYHTTSALFIAVALHLAHIFATAAYRRPREFSWMLGLATALLLPVFAITGNALPMDQDAWHGLQVELAVIAAAPMGDHVRNLLIGGPEIGNATLTRFHTLHVVVLPAVFLALALLHIVIARRRRPMPSETATPAMPRQHLRTLAVVGVALVAIAVVAANVGARLDAPADPTSAFTARPEWYFVVLNQINTWLGSVGAIIVPPLLIGFLLSIPFIDRRSSGRPAPVVLVPTALMALGVLALTVVGIATDAGDEALAKENAKIRNAAAEALASFSSHGVDAEGRLPFIAALHVYRDRGCASCHDKKDEAAPRLAGWGSIERTDAFLKDPDDDRFFKHTPLKGQMSAFGGDDAARRALAIYLHHENGLPAHPDATPAALAAGRLAFEDDGCDACHNDPKVSLRDKKYDFRAIGPDLVGYAGPEWTRALIRDAHHPTFFGGVVEDSDLDKLMPPYMDLDDAELSLLVQWLSAGAPGAH